MYQIAWLHVSPNYYCWAASIDGGKSWNKLNADNGKDSLSALEEASTKYGIAKNKWQLLDDPIIRLT